MNATSVLMSLSSELAGVVEYVAPSVVRVDDGSRLTATGVIWSEDGVIATTSHGVERDEELAVELADGSRHAATLVGRDPDTDIAVLRVEATGLPAMERADASEAKVGHLALALGRPGDSGLQATIGIISARLDSQRGGNAEFVLHTDAIFYPGFSGGALVNISGRMLGMSNLIFGRGKSVAVGAPVVTHAVEALLAHGRIQRGYLGVRTQLVGLPEHLLQGLGLTQKRGLLLVQVEPSGPAEQSGLLPGDIILSVGQTLTEEVETLRNQLRSYTAGQSVPLRLIRGGQLMDLTATLGAES